MGAPTATSVLNRARTQLGTGESPQNSNRTPYGAWYGWQGVSWCDIFISWLFGQFAGGLDLIGGKNAYTPSHAAWFKAHGRWGSTPRVGAIAFFDFPDSVKRIQHVGIVEKVLSGSYVQTIEGNTGPGDAGSQDNGDGVYRRVRHVSYIVGYGYPDYSAAGLVKPAPGATKERKTAPLLVDGVWGKATTRALQRFLGLKDDGVIGPVTRKALQRWLGVTADGSWGRVTRRALQRKLGVRADGAWGKDTVRALQRYLNRH